MERGIDTPIDDPVDHHLRADVADRPVGDDREVRLELGLRKAAPVAGFHFLQHHPSRAPHGAVLG